MNPGEQFLLYTNPPDAFRRYHALQLVYTKRWAGNWQLQASYTRSKTAATVGNGDFTNAGVNDTGDLTGTRNPSVFMNPNGAINAEGRAVYDKNELKVLESTVCRLRRGERKRSSVAPERKPVGAVRQLLQHARARQFPNGPPGATWPARE